MGRLHLFELEDQTWCPSIIREITTDFLVGLYKSLKIYEPAYKKIEEILQKTNTTAIVDCCSGSGGPIRHLRDYLDKAGKYSIKITLTDKYPNIKVIDALEKDYSARIDGIKEAIDATKMPSSFPGMRTFFSSFHHFPPVKAKQILQDAVNNNAPICIFECTQRSFTDFVSVLASPIVLLFIMPRARNLTWKKFLLTYILPIAPFTHMWDYFASIMRTYSPKELKALVSELDAPGYTWEIGNLGPPNAKPYLIGYKT